MFRNFSTPLTTIILALTLVGCDGEVMCIGDPVEKCANFCNYRNQYLDDVKVDKQTCDIQCSCQGELK